MFICVRWKAVSHSDPINIKKSVCCLSRPGPSKEGWSAGDEALERSSREDSGWAISHQCDRVKMFWAALKQRKEEKKQIIAECSESSCFNGKVGSCYKRHDDSSSSSNNRPAVGSDLLSPFPFFFFSCHPCNVKILCTRVEEERARRAEHAHWTQRLPGSEQQPGAPGVPPLIPAPYTRDQPLANRDIYTLVKVGRCYPAVVESRRMPGIIRLRAKPALAASLARLFWFRLWVCVCVCVSAEQRRKVSSVVVAC